MPLGCPVRGWPQSAPPTRTDSCRSRRISSHHPEHLSNWDNRRIPAGETYVLADIQGAGKILNEVYQHETFNVGKEEV